MILLRGATNIILTLSSKYLAVKSRVKLLLNLTRRKSFSHSYYEILCKNWKPDLRIEKNLK